MRVGLWPSCMAAVVLLPGLATGAPGSALDFDGTDDCAAIPHDPSLPDVVFSVAAWIQTVDDVGSHSIVGIGEDDVNDLFPWHLLLVDGSFTVQISDEDDVGVLYDSGEAVADGQWHHVAATLDASNELRVYVDGVLRLSNAGTPVPASSSQQDLTIGCIRGFFGPAMNPQPPDLFFDGRIDDVAVWDRALSDLEIAAVFTQSPAPSSAGLVGLWRFDEGSGQIVGDDSSAANDGTRGATALAEADDPTWVASDAPIACPPQTVPGLPPAGVALLIVALAAVGSRHLRAASLRRPGA